MYAQELFSKTSELALKVQQEEALTQGVRRLQGDRDALSKELSAMKEVRLLRPLHWILPDAILLISTSSTKHAPHACTFTFSFSWVFILASHLLTRSPLLVCFVIQRLAEKDIELQALTELREDLAKQVCSLEAEKGVLCHKAKEMEEVRIPFFFFCFSKR